MHNEKMNRLRQYLPIFTWIGIFLTPILITVLEGEHPTMKWYIANLLLVFSICSIFYINFYFLVDKYIVNKHLIKFIFINAVIATILIALDYWGIGKILRYRSTYYVMILQNDIAFALVCLSLMALSVSLSVSIRMTEYSYESMLKITEVEKMQAETELANLKNQINPHFLFNTLNNIYALMSVNVDQARNTLHDLSHLLRYVIYDTAEPMISLQNEIEFIKKYVHIAQIRLGDKVDIKATFPDDCKNLQIAPLILIPFIENAFKHGVNFQKKSFVNIFIVLYKDTLICQIHNSNHAKKTGSSGVGIENTTKRLNLLYPKQYELEHYETNLDTYITNLKIVLQQ